MAEKAAVKNGNGSDSDTYEPTTFTTVAAHLDDQPFSWFHVKAILIAGVGFFTDAYDLFVIGIVKPMIGIIYYPQFNGKIPLSDDLWITGVALAGTLLGQIAFGLMGDYVGRKKIYLITLMIMIGATIAQALSASVVKGFGVVAVLCFWRFILGIGIGGDYPLSASIVVEYANRRWRGAFLAAVFAAQGFGIVSGAIVGIVVTAIFQNSIKNTSILYLDYVWRIIIGLGCVPAVLTIYIRSKLPETPLYTAEVAQDVERAHANLAAIGATGKFTEPSSENMNRISWKDLNYYLTYPSILKNRNFWVLIGTASTWFFLDIAFYSQNLFLPNVLTTIGYNPTISLPAAKIYKANPHAWPGSVVTGAQPNITIGAVFPYDTPVCHGICAQQVYTKVFRTCAGNAIVAMMGTVPGYWFTIAFVDYIGRVPIQAVGFCLTTTLLIILASAYNSILSASKWIFIVLYALTFFFMNFGPNATTFIVPAEVFVTKYRSTLHGMSAASGKAGAVVGAIAIGRCFLTTSITLQTTLAILAATNFVGLIMTSFIPETKRLPLAEASRGQGGSKSLFQKILESRGITQVSPVEEKSISEMAK